MRTIALAMFAALTLGMLGPVSGLLATATADEPRPPIAPLTWEDVPLAIDSGIVQHDGTVAGVQSVFARVIESEGAAWVRLEFGDVELGNSLLGGNGATLRITSLKDGAVQYLDAVSIKQWSYTSAYFNGSAVLVELLAHPGTAPSRIQIKSVQHGVHEVSGHNGICNGQDDRVPVTAAPDARTFPTGCTAFLIGERCFLSAGHCGISGTSVIHFNLPFSNADGSLNLAHPNDQYPLDGSSIQLQNDPPTCDNDWAYYGVFDNSNTGLSPLSAQGEFYTLASQAPPPANQQVRIRGYGQTIHGGELPNQWNQVLKIAFGPYVALSGTVMFFQADVSGGDSGSAIFDTTSGTVIGITTCNGCAISGINANHGMVIHQAQLQNALANPQGVCAGSICPPSNRSCYQTGGPGCADEACCATVCAQDAFCCDVGWDSLCVDQAIDLCFGCGHPNAGSCCVDKSTPYCDNFACCEAVCQFDSFCCNVRWDSLCVEGAKTTSVCRCNNCPADLNGDGVVDSGDLLILLAAWGPNPGHSADLNGDGVVDSGDLLILLAAWGPCPEKVCDEAFQCGGEIPWCNEDEFCACISTLAGGIECLFAGVGCGQTCPTGSCPVGQICVTGTCCNGGAPTCIEAIHCEPAVPLCDVGFVCGDTLANCEGFEGTTCSCWNGFGGDFVCGDSDVFCIDLQTCPSGSCPPGFVCAVDTCCGEPVCLPACEEPVHACDDVFECGFPDGFCETACACHETYDGVRVCMSNAPCGGQTCPSGTCPAGQVCVVETCCGAAVCFDIGYLECGSPATANFDHGGATSTGSNDSSNRQPADRIIQSPVPQPGAVNKPDAQPAIDPRRRSNAPAGMTPSGEIRN